MKLYKHKAPKKTEIKNNETIKCLSAGRPPGTGRKGGRPCAEEVHKNGGGWVQANWIIRRVECAIEPGRES